MKREVEGRRWEDERVVVWMPRLRRMRRDSSVGKGVFSGLEKMQMEGRASLWMKEGCASGGKGKVDRSLFRHNVVEESKLFESVKRSRT